METGATRPRKPPAKKAPVKRKVGYHHGDLRQALLDGGLHLLATHGIAGLTLRECAKLAGVSQAAIRNHFADKNALLAGLAARGFEVLARRREECLRTDADLRTCVHGVIENYVGFAIEYPDLFRLMFASGDVKRSAHPVLGAAAHQAYDALCALLADGFESQGFATDDIDTPTFQLWSAMHGLAMLVIDDQYGPRIARDAKPMARGLQLAQLLVDGWGASRAAEARSVA